MVSSTYLSRGIADAERSARLVLESEPAGSEWRYAGLVPLGQALFLAGRNEEARVPLEEARTLPGARRRATSVLALAYLSLIELADGDAEHAERLARDALALAEEIGHVGERRRRQSAHRPRMCPDARRRISMRRSSTSNVPSSSPARTNRRTGTRTPSSTSPSARHRLGDSAGARDALSTCPRRSWTSFRTSGCSGSSTGTTDDALHHRARHEGFLGDELSDAERRVLDLLLDGLSVSRRRARALALAEHGEDASAKHLPQARSDDARGDGRARGRGRDPQPSDRDAQADV